MRKLIKMEKKKENPLEVRMEIDAYTDVSNIKIGRSQVGLRWECEMSGEKCIIYWKSRRGKRVARSTLEMEAISLNERLKMALYIQEMWEELGNGTSIGVVGKKDSRTLEKAKKGSHMSEQEEVEDQYSSY